VSRMSPLKVTARKLLKLSGAAVVGTAVAAMFAAPAFAWSATLTPDAKCADNGTVTVKWTVHNNEDNWDAHFWVTGHTPADSTVSVDKKGADLPGGEDVTFTQTGVPSETGGSVTVLVVWPKHGDKRGDHRTVTVSFEGLKCEKPSPSPSKSVGGGGGGEGTPTPSTTAVPPSLPVTGPNAAIYGGGAAALLVAGGTLFIVARRRRIRFEA
jgi:hypothetical protein